MFRSSLLAAVSALVIASSAAAITIDDFTDAGVVTTTLVAASADGQFDAVGMGIVGGERDVNVTRTSGGIAGETSATFGAGLFDYLESDAGRDGTFRIDYDGNDNSAALDATGLLGLDFSAGGHDRFRLPVASSNEAFTMTITVRTDAANFSTADLAIPVTGSALNLQILFSSFVIGGGTGADFGNVGSLSVEIANAATATDFSLGSIGVFQTIPEPGAGPLLGPGRVGDAASRRRVRR